MPEAKNRQWHLEEAPIPRVGEASSQVINTLVGEVVKVAMETAAIAGEVVKMADEALEAPHRVVETADEAAKMVEVGYGIITTIDQATSGVHGAPNEASDSHSSHVVEVTMLPARKDRASRRHYPKVMKARRPTVSSLKTPKREAYFSMLEKYVPSEF